jgi:hypothetical protein
MRDNKKDMAFLVVWDKDRYNRATLEKKIIFQRDLL